MGFKIPKPSTVLDKGAKVAAKLEKRVRQLERDLKSCEKSARDLHVKYLALGAIIRDLKKELGKPN